MGSESVARMTSKGQVTLPKAIRDKMKVGKGDYLLFRVKGKRVELEKVDLSWEERFSKLAQTVEERFKKRGVTKKDIEEAIEWARKSS
jgi:antitoxin PrlF